MWDYDELTSFSVSGVPKTLAQRFLLLAKRMGQSRSGLIKMLMEASVNNAMWWFEKEATMRQFSEHSVNDTFSAFGMNFLEKDKNFLDKEIA